MFDEVNSSQCCANDKHKPKFGPYGPPVCYIQILQFPEYQAKFYYNRRNLYLHMGLDKSLFSYEIFEKLLEEVDCFLNEYLSNKFACVFPPKLIHSTKWKHDYTIYKKMAKDIQKTI